MSALPAAAPIKRTSSLVEKFAANYNIDPDKLLPILKATAFKQSAGDPEVTNEQMVALLVVADQYKLNPFTKEIYAFYDSRKGIVPVVSVDGWVRIINEHPQFDGVEFDYGPARGKNFEWIECVMYRKDRSKPTRTREFWDEVKRGTKPWETHGNRMHRHKALIQCARVAFGFAGIYDEDEARGIIEHDVTPASAPGAQALPAYEREAFDINLPVWKKYVDAGRKTPADIIATVSSKHTLTDDQKKAIEALGAKDALATDADIEAMAHAAAEANVPMTDILAHIDMEDLAGLTVTQLEAAKAFIAEVK